MITAIGFSGGLRTGDRLLVSSDKIGSSSIRWWLNSEYSHVVPILNEEGKTLEIRYPKIHFSNVSDYMGGKHKILHLRPAIPLTDIQIASYLFHAERLNGTKYDIKTFIAYLTNSGGKQDKIRVDCSSGMLVLDQAMGILRNRSMRFVSPQSYVEFLAAGVFKVVE